jgi:pyruvate/2-oxoglutarate dehydrogenase complex dihydrolipoamide dehydrogenase (E3) component
MPDTYDLIVLGAGPTGENVAARAVRGGLSAAIVESELVGGECSYWACMPSKALLRPVGVADEAAHVAGVTGTRLEPEAVLARRDRFAHDWNDDGQVEWVRKAGVDLFRGPSRITGVRSVKVGDSELRANHAVAVCTGSRAVVPPALAAARPWTSREATSARAAPGRLAIVGGGVVGCEMAAAWQALGSQVTLLPRGRLLDRVDGFAGDLVADGLRAAGADVRLGVSATEATREPDGTVTLSLSDGTRLVADEVLAATGRAPRTDDIGLEATGLVPGSWLEVDDTMRVRGVKGEGPGGTGGGSPPYAEEAGGGWLYAAGDVTHLALLTHMGKYQGRICGDAIAARASGREPGVTDRADYSCVPQVIFTVPEVATVGLSATQAEHAGYRLRAVEYDIGEVAGSKLFADGYTGRARMVVDEDRRVIVGATLAGPGVGEMIHAATVAIAGEVPLERLWHAVPSYPTISEVWLRLLESYGL